MSNRIRTFHRAGAVPLALTLVFATACSEPMGPQPGPRADALPILADHESGNPDPGSSVSVCKEANAGTFGFTIEVQGTGGEQLVADDFTVDASTCVLVWHATQQDAEPTSITVTEIQAADGYFFDRLEVASAIDGVYTVYEPTTTVHVKYFHGAQLFFYNQKNDVPPPPPPPPPPGDCSGLTPGYWKNWDNHYTPSEFLSLLPGTIAEGLGASGAVAILSYGGKDMLAKLRKFVLANQLTMNLVGSGLFNDGSKFLDEGCRDPGTGEGLGDALTAALEALAANGTGYTKDQLGYLKDILDRIANLGGG